MKEKLTKNIGLKILSVVVAFFIWLLVVNVSNPEVSRSQEVALEILNESVFADAGKTYDINRHSVTVAYDVHTLDEARIRASDFRATIDLSQVYDVTGSVVVSVEVLNNSNLLRNVTARPNVVTVTTEDLQTKEFALTGNITGRPMEDYSVNQVVLSPSAIRVSGPVSQVGLINSVGVEINVSRSGEDLSGVASPSFYDANGNALPASSVNKVTADTEEIAYYVSINRNREVPLVFEVAGVPAEGFRYAGYEATESGVRVGGSEEALTALEQITISSDDLNIDGATADRFVEVDIRPHLPAGIYLADEEQAVAGVRLLIEELITRTIHLSESEVTITGMDSGFNYRLDPATVEFAVRGTESDLSVLRVEDYGVVIDVSGLGEGTHSVNISYTQDDDRFTVVYAEPATVIVTRRDTGPGLRPDERREEEIRLPIAEPPTVPASDEEETTETETEPESEEETEEEESGAELLQETE